MSTHKYIDRICVAVMICAVILTLLFMNGEALGMTALVDEDAESYTGTENFTANDLNGEWDTSGATVITLDGDTIRISGNGAYAMDGSVYITGGGCYVLSGELTDGSVVVDAYQSSKVWLLFDGVDITCSDGAGLVVEEADKVFLTLAEGSVNRISCGETYSDEALSDGIDGAIYARDDLTINGSGTLVVTAEYRHGIVANDDLVITGGTIEVTAAADAIHVNESFRITGAALTLNAGDDGIHSDTSILVAGGTIEIPTCYEGLEAVTIEVTDGDITIYPTDDGINANGGSGSFFDAGPGGFGGMARPGSEDSDTETSAEESLAEALADTSSQGSDDEETYISISGGSITIINENARDSDGLDSNGSIYISGGMIFVSLTGDGASNALDYASENGAILQVTGGTVVACGGSSMAEDFDESSTQCAVLYNLTETVSDGTSFILKDADGNILLSYDVPCSFSSVAFSCPEMTVGETYQVIIGDSAEEITLESTATSLGASSGIGGFGGFGGFSGFSSSGDSDSSSGFGGFGKPGSRPGSSDSDESEDGSESGRPERPDMSGFPQMSEDGEMPDMSSLPQMGGMPDGEEGIDDSIREDETPEVVTAVKLSELGSDSWLLLILSGAVLAAGLITAVLYRRRTG